MQHWQQLMKKSMMHTSVHATEGAVNLEISSKTPTYDVKGWWEGRV
jgi:hypothetical protein